MKIKTMIRRNAEAETPELQVSEISVQRLIDDSLLALSREIRNLLVTSASRKLNPTEARDLRDHLKLLFELKDREDASLRGLTDEQLNDLLQKKEDTNDI